MDGPPMILFTERPHQRGVSRCVGEEASLSYSLQTKMIFIENTFYDTHTLSFVGDVSPVDGLSAPKQTGSSTHTRAERSQSSAEQKCVLQNSCRTTAPLPAKSVCRLSLGLLVQSAIHPIVRPAQSSCGCGYIGPRALSGKKKELR